MGLSDEKTYFFVRTISKKPEVNKSEKTACLAKCLKGTQE
jgi:hypothetical protein